jgi:hypothetical protein
MLRRKQLEQAGRSPEHFIFFFLHPLHATTSFFFESFAFSPSSLSSPLSFDRLTGGRA